MTLDDIINYSEFTDCSVTFGSPDGGFATVNAGVHNKFNNYRRFLAHNELSSLPSAEAVLPGATTFRIQRNSETEELSREEFQKKLDRFFEKLD